MGVKKPAEEYGSIVYIVGRARAYGIRAVLVLPKKYHVYGQKEFQDLLKTDPRAVFHNYFDAYFSLSGDPSGEDARVEAGILKYSGPMSAQWKCIRMGVGGSEFHGELYGEHHFLDGRVSIELTFKPNDRKTIRFKVNQALIKGEMVLNIPPSEASYNAGGLFPKASFGIANFAGKVDFGKMTLLDIEVSHDKALAETSWKPLTDFTLSEKFTRKDKIKHTRHPFSAWTTETP